MFYTLICSDLGGTVFTQKYGLPLTIVIIVVMALVTVGVNVVPKLTHRNEIRYETRDLTYGAVCLALSYALSWIKLFEMPLGGSVTLAALAPLFIYCYYFGFRKAAVISAAYMLLQFTQSTFIVHPLSALLDYVIPYYSVCLVGLFAYRPDRYASFVKGRENDGAAMRVIRTLGGHWRIFVGVVVFLAVRYFSSTISGVVLWEYWEYPPADLGYIFGFSLAYNSVLLIDGAIATAAVLLLLTSRMFNVFMTSRFRRKPREESE